MTYPRAMPMDDILVVVVSHAKRHQRLALAELTWLQAVPHVFYSDVDSPAAPFVAGVLPTRPTARTAYHRQSDYKLPLAVLAANRSYGGRFKWLALVDDDTVLNLPVLTGLLRRADHNAPLFLAPSSAATPKSDQRSGCARNTSRPHGRSLWNSLCAATDRRCERTIAASKVRPECATGVDGNVVAELQRGKGLERIRSHERCDDCFCPTRWAKSEAIGHFVLDSVLGEVSALLQPTLTHHCSTHPVDRAPCVSQATLTPATYYPYGGTGMLLSAGLLRVIPEQSWADCADRLVCGSSDFRVATCVRHLAGV